MKYCIILYLSFTMLLFSENKIEDLQKQLSSQDIIVRNQALQEIVFLYEKTVPLLPSLVKILDQENGQNAYLAIQSIGNTGKKATIAIPKLISIISKKKDFFLRYYAIQALGQIKNNEAISILQKATRDKNSNIRSVAILALHNISPPNFLSFLEKLAKDNDILVQKAIIATLQNRPYDEQVSRILFFGIKHPDIDIRFYATQLFQLTSENINKAMPIYLKFLESKEKKIVINAIIDFGNAKKLAIPAIPALLKLLTDKNLKAYARNTILKIGSVAVPDIVTLLKSKNESERQQAVMLISRLIRSDEFFDIFLRMSIEDSSGIVRSACLTALKNTKIISKETVKYLEKKLLDKNNLPAILTIGTLQITSLSSHLMTLLKDKKNNFRKEIYISLGKISLKDSALIDVLIKALDDDDNEIKKIAIRSLGSMKEKGASAVTSLMKILDVNNKLHVLAILSLGKIGEKASIALPLVTEIFQKTKSNITKHYCSNTMIKIGTSATPYFLELLQDPNISTRIYSINGLKHMKTTEKILKALKEVMEKEQNTSVKHKVKLIYNYHYQILKNKQND